LTSAVAAIVVAAGRGLRAGGPIAKQYRTIAGEPVVRLSLSLFAHHPEISRVQPVIHSDDCDLFARAAAGLAAAPPVLGGTTRQASVRAGLAALADHPPEIVLIHDAARPFASPALVSRAIAAGRESGAAIPAIPVVDTVKSVGAGGEVTGTLERNALRTVQTPQAFAYAQIVDAHRQAAAQGREHFTDDAALAEWAGMRVTVFDGEQGNVKLTLPSDFERAQSERSTSLSDIRSATGFDVHAFAEGDHVTLGGVRIPHDHGLTGHSDADVALHALTDAVLGTLAEGDIGEHFPPSDSRWRGASSDQFLAFATERVRARGGRITGLDLTLLCEAPRIGPYRDAMRARIAAIAGIAPARVAVKATTMEGLGFIGRREGIAALATATVRLPGDGDDRA
jgi:2-C-methyl-D-erythritol 4-phosphate cytidylyltransferase / 2-C-methyl-D-erythritol 2,4-cyclodiphosphate synthase